MATCRHRRVLARAVDFAGVSLHSGRRVRVRVSSPVAETQALSPDHGITFRMSGRSPIRACAEAIDPTRSMLCTQLRAPDDSWRVSTVEHLMAALVAARVSVADVEILENDRAGQVVEMPILDGSALPFVQAIRQAGIHELDSQPPTSYLRIRRPVQVSMKDKAAWFLPIPEKFPGVRGPTLHVSVQVNFPHKGLGSHFAQFSFSGDADADLVAFEREIAPARTFTFEDEIKWMQANDLALGGSLDNAVVFQSGSHKVVNPEGLRFPEDEWVRHKLLDCVGDLGLVGMPVHGYFFSTSPGHALTQRLIKELFADPTNFSIVYDGIEAIP